MNYLKTYSKDYINQLIRKRDREIKLGECVQTVHQDSFEKDLKNSSAKFVLLGLPEDIGVRANYGRGGTHTAWQPALYSLLNMQSNAYLHGKELLVLGHIAFDDLMESAGQIDFTNKAGIHQAREMVTEIDKRVIAIVQWIVAAGKIPIIIGGGHNNAYGNIKGAALGLMEAKKIKSAQINCINCDAHADFRRMEGRHSGNGFRYAYEEGFLNRYSIVGLHQSYTAQSVFDELIKQSDKIHFSFFEDIFIHEIVSFNQAIKEAVEFLGNPFFGVELDMDAVQSIPTSARTSSGISAGEARRYVTLAASHPKVAYLHIAEAAPVLSHIKTDNKTGKLIAYLIADFIKAQIE